MTQALAVTGRRGPPDHAGVPFHEALERIKSIPSAQTQEVSFAVFAWEPESMPGSALAPSAKSLSARQFAIRSDPGSNNETQSLALSSVPSST